MCIALLSRFLAVIRRHFTIRQHFALEYFFAVLESDEVGIDNAIEHSYIRSITGSRYNGLVPAFKRIGILCRILLGRFLAAIDRHSAVLYLLGLQQNTVLILETDDKSQFRIASIAVVVIRKGDKRTGIAIP